LGIETNISKNTVQFFNVFFFNLRKNLVYFFTNISIIPMVVYIIIGTVFGKNETLSVQLAFYQLFIIAILFFIFIVMVFPYVAQIFNEHKNQNIVFVFR